MLDQMLERLTKYLYQGWRQEFSDGGADSSDEWTKIWFSGYYKCQKSPKNRFSPSDGGYSPLALPWRHSWPLHA